MSVFTHLSNSGLLEGKDQSLSEKFKHRELYLKKYNSVSFERGHLLYQQNKNVI